MINQKGHSFAVVPLNWILNIHLLIIFLLLTECLCFFQPCCSLLCARSPLLIKEKLNYLVSDKCFTFPSQPDVCSSVLYISDLERAQSR